MVGALSRFGGFVSWRLPRDSCRDVGISVAALAPDEMIKGGMAGHARRISVVVIPARIRNHCAQMSSARCRRLFISLFHIRALLCGFPLARAALWVPARAHCFISAFLWRVPALASTHAHTHACTCVRKKTIARY